MFCSWLISKVDKSIAFSDEEKTTRGLGENSEKIIIQNKLFK